MWRAGPGQGRIHVRVGVDPPALPQRQLGQVHVVDPQAPVLAQRREGGVEVRLGGREVAPPELELGAVHEQHVRIVGGDAADRSGTEPVGVVPLAGRDERLDEVGDEHGRVAAVAAHDLEAAAPDLDGLAGPSEHHQHVGERDVGDEQVCGAAPSLRPGRAPGAAHLSPSSARPR